MANAGELSAAHSRRRTLGITNQTHTHCTQHARVDGRSKARAPGRVQKSSLDSRTLCSVCVASALTALQWVALKPHRTEPQQHRKLDFVCVCQARGVSEWNVCAGVGGAPVR